MKTLSAPYLRIQKDTIEVFKSQPKGNIYDTIIKDAILIYSDSAITYTGSEICFDFFWHKTFIQDIKNPDIEESSYQYGCANPIDFIRRIKKPYVHYWVQKKSVRQVSVTTNRYKLIINEL